MYYYKIIFLILNIILFDMLPNASSCAQCTVRPNATETSEFGAEKGLFQGYARRWVAHAQKTPNSPKGFSKAFCCCCCC